ncbi:MAG: FAD:protein FMN transferase [Gammaproteobacteria bacterium]|nr:FAD:protein FMN transferase [Gammaproteobacteria bacterium]
MVSLERCEEYWLGSFQAMASPCEILMEVEDQGLASDLLSLAMGEAQRIEAKFSRYRDDNIIAKINTSKGKKIHLDEESAGLLDCADRFHCLSKGLFDITAGVLRRIWSFDGTAALATQAQINAILPLVGWSKVNWHSPYLQLPTGMEIDLGGIGKEYAVDQVVQLIARQTQASVLVNFGGDLALTCSKKDGSAWRVASHSGDQQGRVLALHSGALATSGDSHRYLLNEGVRYSHILNPHTGWPVQQTVGSVTVAASSCVEAGMLATLALLQGSGAERFLEQQEVMYWLN